ncbi:heme biosynthesis HemY N-terminal domain-containing protein [Pelagibius sp. 7325]|uniref:heme biosynthesis protein HemY n=1 Tax=Pelagibius sp. 7325 TaxID=3131994 RepID=UPI0030EC67C6
MRRAILFAVLAAAASLAAYWLALHPGQISIQWLGYRLEPPIGLLVLAVLAFTVVVILLYRVIRAILGTPRRIGQARTDSRRSRGYKALSQGMVAVAAGDAQEAQRWSRRAEDLLEDPPITLLLAAQAAQLNGDEKAAEKYFNAMLEKPETRFLGLRGLLMQALREGDHQRALGYVRQAHALRPKTPWVVTNLFELSQRSGDLEAASAALKQAVKIKAMDKADADHKGAVITLAKAERLLAEGQKEEAFTQARLADRSDPDLLAAALLHARLAVERKAWKEAAKVVERSWPRTPSAELAALYRAAAPEAKPLEQVKRFTRLAALNPKHRESHLALAEATLEAGLWGEARRHLAELVTLAGEDPPRAQVCRLMARLEEAERHDTASARRWLERAAAAPPDPAWVCDSCGAVASRWSANCGSCGTFDSLDWRLPRRVGALAAAGDDLPRIAAKAAPPVAPPAPHAAPVVELSAAGTPRLPAVTPLPGPPDRVKPIAKPEGEGDGAQRPQAAEPAARPADDDDSDAAAVEGYMPPRPTS